MLSDNAVITFDIESLKYVIIPFPISDLTEYEYRISD